MFQSHTRSEKWILWFRTGNICSKSIVHVIWYDFFSVYSNYYPWFPCSNLIVIIFMVALSFLPYQLVLPSSFCYIYLQIDFMATIVEASIVFIWLLHALILYQYLCDRSYSCSILGSLSFHHLHNLYLKVHGANYFVFHLFSINHLYAVPFTVIIYLFLVTNVVVHIISTRTPAFSLYQCSCCW